MHRFVNGHLSRPQDLAVFNDVRPSISSETAEFLHDHLGVSPSFLAVILRKSWELKSGNCQWVRAIPGANGEGSIVGKGSPCWEDCHAVYCLD